MKIAMQQSLGLCQELFPQQHHFEMKGLILLKVAVILAQRFFAIIVR